MGAKILPYAQSITTRFYLYFNISSTSDTIHKTFSKFTLYANTKLKRIYIYRGFALYRIKFWIH